MKFLVIIEDENRENLATLTLEENMQVDIDIGNKNVVLSTVVKSKE